MAELSAEQLNAQAAQKIQIKFDFYAVALTFTTLAFSLETAHFGRGLASDAIEFIAWAGLFVSGLAGLSRLSYAAQVLFAYSRRVGMQESVTEVKKAAATEGKTSVHSATLDATVPASLFVTMAEESLKRTAPSIERMEKRLERRYRLQLWGFVLGILSLVVARGLPHLVNLFGYRLL